MTSYLQTIANLTKEIDSQRAAIRKLELESNRKVIFTSNLFVTLPKS